MSNRRWGPYSAWMVAVVLAVAVSVTASLVLVGVRTLRPSFVTTEMAPVMVHTVTTPVCKGYVGLTYDDGPTDATPALVTALRAHGLHATFFEIGYKVRDTPQYTRAVHDAGMEIGVHTWDHPHLPTLSPDVINWQMTSTIDQIKAATGVTPTLFRPPYGDTNQTIRDIAARNGMTEVIWTTDPDDWVDGETVAQTAKVVAGMKAGDVILMHDATDAAVQAVPLIAETLAAKDLCAGRIVPTNIPVYVWEGLTYNAGVAPWDRR
ncbi:MAG TPA: polysaccharide deacetylase family protein [Mycobacterium sp.]|nr:polysaccharide deacetylase family protein [Mycobacterium sp.]